MDKQYDNTNRGMARQPFPDQQLILTGKLDFDGEDKQIALVKDKDKNGDDVLVVFTRVGCMYLNADADETKNQPKYSGPLDGGRRIAAWKKVSETGNHYLSLSHEPKRNGGAAPVADDNPVPLKPVEVSLDDINF